MMKAPRLRKLLLWPLLSTCLVMPTVCTAQAYPGKSVRIIVPAAPSGGLDIMARVVGQPLAVMWGHPVVVDNRPGAGVMLGTEIASRATPDGYTMLMVNANLAPNAILHDKLPVVKGLTAIIKIADLPNALSVPAQLPVHSMEELIALAKSSPLTYGSAGHGTVGNILAEMLKLATGTNITHVPYKGGGPVMVAVTGGQVSFGIVSLASTMAHAKAGRVRILADYVERYEADGFVIHSVKSCNSFSAGQLMILREVEKRTGVPGAFIESDLVDPRYFSNANIKNRLESYFQMIESRRRGAGAAAHAPPPATVVEGAA